jgi:hypothetical protein
MRNHVLPPRRALPALAALLACGAMAGAPALARAADPGLTLSALAPGSWLQADGSFHIPLQLLATGLISIDRLQIEVVGVPGSLTVSVPVQPVASLEGPSLAVDLPGIAGNRTIRVTVWVLGEQPAYGVGVAATPIVAETMVALAPPGGGVQPLFKPIAKGGTGTPLAVKPAVRPKVLVLRMQTIKGKRYAFIKSSAAVRLELKANRRVGKTWRTAKKLTTRLVAQKVRRVPLGLAKPGRYVVRAVIRDGAGLTGTRSVKLVLKAFRP